MMTIINKYWYIRINISDLQCIAKILQGFGVQFNASSAASSACSGGSRLSLKQRPVGTGDEA